jgi:hypothetical protein
MPGVPHENYGAPLSGKAESLCMNFRDQRTGGINHAKMFGLSPGSDFRRNTVGTEDNYCPRRDLLDLIHKHGSFGRERLDHVFVVDNLPADIYGGRQ